MIKNILILSHCSLLYRTIEEIDDSIDITFACPPFNLRKKNTTDTWQKNKPNSTESNSRVGNFYLGEIIALRDKDGMI
jgi:DNA modification methylase